MGAASYFRRGSLMWFAPQQEHHLAHRTSDAQYYVAVFKPEMIEGACRDPRYVGLSDKETTRISATAKAIGAA